MFELGDAGQLKLFMSKEHRFGTDSLLLGEFARNVKNKVVVDLCSGCGIIPLLLLNRESKNQARKIVAVEIQQEAADLLRHTVAENALAHLIEVVQGDLKSAEVLMQIGRETVDLVTANPPYYSQNSGFERDSKSQKTARYEHGDESGCAGCTLVDVVKAAEYLLKFGGELKMCMTAPRLCECIAAMQSCSIEPKEIMLIPAKKSNTARLFLISGKKGGKSGINVCWKQQAGS